MKKLTFICVFFSLNLTEARGQSIDQDQITNIISVVNENLSKLHQTKDKSGVQKYFSDKYSFTNVNHLMDGKTNIIHGNMQDFNSYLDLIITQIQVSYQISNIYNVLVKDGIGIAVYDVEYEIIKEGETISKGYEAQISTLKKEDSEWKFFYSKRANIEELLSKGVCLSEVFKGKSTNYIAKVRVPTGTHYSVELLEFDFKELKPEGKHVIVNHNTYQWTSDHSVWIEQNGRRTKKIGMGLNESHVVTAILRNDLLNNHCTEIRMRK